MLSLHAARLIYGEFSPPLLWQWLRTPELKAGERDSLAQAKGRAELLQIQQPWSAAAVVFRKECSAIWNWYQLK